MTYSLEDEPQMTDEERAFAVQLRTDRPTPTAGYRGALSRHLAVEDPGYRPRPTNLRLLSACYLAAGALLLALGVLQATGAL